MNSMEATRIPTKWVGPLFFKTMNYLNHQEHDVEISAPLTTYETTLFASVGRGAKVTRLIQNLTTTVISDIMTRSLLFEAESAYEANKMVNHVQSSLSRYQEEVVAKQSKYAILKKIDTRIVGNLIYLRFAFETGNASGHNMTTFASDKIAETILNEFPRLKYLSVSGNFCTDKKVSSVNSLLGRGKHVIAECFIDRETLKTTLRTTPEKMAELNLKKNLIGSIVAGSLHSANAHYANMLLAFYLATGQDGANIVEGSQGITHLEVKNEGLYVSVSLPNIIVGSIGHGKDAIDAASHLKALDVSGLEGSQKLAQIAAGLVLCGELSLLAALSNPQELTKSHQRIERNQE